MSDNLVTITTDADDMPAVHHHHQGIDGGSFTLGLLVGAAGFWFAQRKRRARLAAEPPAPVRDAQFESDVAGLARRTAALEKIVTEPSRRLAQDIDALR